MELIKFGFYSGADYPDLRFLPSRLDHVLEGGVILLLLTAWASAFYFHFGPQPAGAEPSYVWAMAGSSLLTALLLGVSAYLPMRFYSFPVRLTDENVGMQCMLAVRLVRVLNIQLNALLTVCLWLAKDARIMGAAMPVLGVVIALTFIAYYALAYRHR